MSYCLGNIEEIKAKTKGVFIQPYSKDKPNILVVGPISGDKNQEIVFPVLAPDPAQDKTVAFRANRIRWLSVRTMPKDTVPGGLL